MQNLVDGIYGTDFKNPHVFRKLLYVRSIQFWHRLQKSHGLSQIIFWVLSFDVLTFHMSRIQWSDFGLEFAHVCSEAVDQLT